MSAAYKDVIIADLLKIAQDEKQQYEFQGRVCCLDSKDRRIWNLSNIVFRVHDLHREFMEIFVSSFYSAHEIEAKHSKVNYVDDVIDLDAAYRQERTNNMISLSCPELMKRTLTLLNLKRASIVSVYRNYVDFHQPTSTSLAPIEGAPIPALQNALSSQR